MTNSFGLQEWELKWETKQEGKIYKVWVVIAASDLKTAIEKSASSHFLKSTDVRVTMAKRLK